MKKLLILTLMVALTHSSGFTQENEKPDKNRPEEQRKEKKEETRPNGPDTGRTQAGEKGRSEQATPPQGAAKGRTTIDAPPAESRADAKMKIPEGRPAGKKATGTTDQKERQMQTQRDGEKKSPRPAREMTERERMAPPAPAGSVTDRETAMRARAEREGLTGKKNRDPSGTSPREKATTAATSKVEPAPPGTATTGKMDKQAPGTEGAAPEPALSPAEKMQAAATLEPAEAPAPTASRVRSDEDEKTAKAAREKTRRERAQARTNVKEDTRKVLEDRGRRNRSEDQERAREIDGDDDAKTLIYSILGGAAAGAIAGKIATRDRDPGREFRNGSYGRLPYDQVGRDPRDRDQSVNYMVRRFDGNATWNEAPDSWRYRQNYEGRGYGEEYHHPHYFNGNRRVVYYNSYQNIPPILLASNRLNRLDVARANESPYRIIDSDQAYYRNIPEDYRQDDAYAVSYEVDPDSAIILDDILFEQGSTTFSDAYSYDLVVDLAEALSSPEILNERFVIEGHASAEGDYNTNLQLSQERAERISRDLVNMGVAPDRLIPVGYGETEARFPGDAAENERSLDRRVMVFRAKD